MEASAQYTSKAAKDRLAIERILDANLDRAREGIRTIEEWCRFALEDGDRSDRCKQWRQALAALHQPRYRLARHTPTDPGTQLSHPQEERRADAIAVLRANFGRVQEALRVLEEYGKIDAPVLSATAKQMRYQIYSLESEILGSNAVGNDRRQQLREARLYFVTMPCENLPAVVEAALQGGLRLVQYREKEGDDRDRVAMAATLCDLCHRYNALFLVNDRPDIALAVGADGVHLGQLDMPVAVARALLGGDRIIGQSTTNPEELVRALEAGADYVGVGPVYATPTKPGKAAAGLEYVRYAAEHLTIPWFAIGGIDAENLGDVVAAGAPGIAVVRAIAQAENPTTRVRQLLDCLQENPIGAG